MRRHTCQPAQPKKLAYLLFRASLTADVATTRIAAPLVAAIFCSRRTAASALSSASGVMKAKPPLSESE